MPSFKINYKGTSCRGTTFLYRCTTCGNEHEERHPAAEEPTIECHNSECDGTCKKKPTLVNLDADFHDCSKAHNIGWDL